MRPLASVGELLKQAINAAFLRERVAATGHDHDPAHKAGRGHCFILCVDDGNSRGEALKVATLSVDKRRVRPFDPGAPMDGDGVYRLDSDWEGNALPLMCPRGCTHPRRKQGRPHRYRQPC